MKQEKGNYYHYDGSSNSNDQQRDIIVVVEDQEEHVPFLSFPDVKYNSTANYTDNTHHNNRNKKRIFAINIMDKLKKAGVEYYCFSATTFVIALFVLILYMFVYAQLINSVDSVDDLDSKYSVSSANGIYSLSAVNEYGNFDPILSSAYYPFLSNSILIEPYRQSILSLSAFDEKCSYSLTQIQFSNELEVPQSKLSIKSNVNIEDIDGFSWKITVKATGKYNATVSSSCSDSDQLLIWVKYVRRELSTLTENDREEYLSAFYELYVVNTIDGQERYDSDAFRSVQYLSSIHVDAAGNPVCDEFHSGDGFLLNHIFLSNYFEQSLQIVNPKVALHFMEYAQLYSSVAYQSHLSDQLDGGSWNPYLSDAYFGSNDPLTGDILDSRWASMPLPVVDSQFYVDHGIDENKTFFPTEEEEWLKFSSAHLKSPFSLLRPPWNFNPSLSLSRYSNELAFTSITESDYTEYFRASNCEDYQTFIDSYINTDGIDDGNQRFTSILRWVKSQIHGGIHENIGGQGGTHARDVNAQLMDTFGLSEEDIFVISERAHAFFKKYVPLRNYYNDSEYPVYPIACGEDLSVYLSSDGIANEDSVEAVEPGLDGGINCTCVDYYFQSEEALSQLMSMYFDKYMKTIYTQSSTPYKIQDMGFDDNAAIMRLVCSRMSFDGDFVGSGSAFDPIFWVSHPAMEFLLQRIAATTWLGAAGYNFTEPNSCSGHSPTAYPYWLRGLAMQDADATDASSLTNQQLMSLLNPLSAAYPIWLDYIYDTAHTTGCDSVDDFVSVE